MIGQRQPYRTYSSFTWMVIFWHEKERLLSFLRIHSRQVEGDTYSTTRKFLDWMTVSGDVIIYPTFSSELDVWCLIDSPNFFP